METPELWSAITRVAGGLLVIGALAVLVAYALRRSNGVLSRFHVNGPLHILSRHSLGARHSLCIVRIPERILILGLSDHGVSLLTEAPSSAWPATSEPTPPAFGELLKSILPPTKRT